MSARVLFVSKPIVPPFRDGAKCLVRDVARHLTAVTPIVMSVPEAPSLGPGIEQAAVYARAGAFTPSARDNARAALWLLLRSRADLWHFVFAPNPRTSRVGRWLRRLRRVPVLQTIASPPRDFRRAAGLLFGDVVVAQSRFTAERLGGAGIEVIPPPVAAITPPSADAIAAQRKECELAPDAPVFVYPGDLEHSGGAEAVAQAVAPILRELPAAVFVFACRHKTPAAPAVERALATRLGPAHARFAPNPSDLMALLAGATAVLFPVDDLWGKVDLPIVLLEAMSLGVPVIAYDAGPLRELEGTIRVAPAELVRAALDVARDPQRRGQVAEAERAAVERHYRADAVARQYERLYARLLSR